MEIEKKYFLNRLYLQSNVYFNLKLFDFFDLAGKLFYILLLKSITHSVFKLFFWNWVITSNLVFYFVKKNIT